MVRLNSCRWLYLATMFALVAFPAVGIAQDAANTAESEVFQVVGIVVDRQSGEALPDAKVEFAVVGTDTEPVWTGQSNEDGRFITSPLAVGGYEITVTAISYSPVTHFEIFPNPAIMDLRVEAVRVDYQLEPLIVTAQRPTRLERSGFYRREQAGVGHYVNLAEIQARQAYDVSDLFMRIPGARVSPGGLGEAGAIGLRGGCTPQVVVDGLSLAPPVRIDEMFQPGDLEAIEVYHGPTAPIEYNGRSTCGTIMIWSRNPPEPTGNYISFKKMLVVVGFTALAAITTSR